MKLLSTVIASALVSGISIATISNADAMGRREDPEYNDFMMKAADADGDGKLTRAEYVKMAADMAGKEFDMYNLDNNDHLSKQEFHSGQR